MPQTLEGSCHCGAVKFSVQSSASVPYQICFCSICRKGRENISTYHAVLSNRGEKDEKRASSERCFCMLCGTMLWLSFAKTPDQINPFASAIDTPLEPPEEMTLLMTELKPDWARLPKGHIAHDKWPDAESMVDWHKRHGSSEVIVGPGQFALIAYGT